MSAGAPDACHQFKGGSGLRPAVEEAEGRRIYVGVLVQANHDGARI